AKIATVLLFALGVAATAFGVLRHRAAAAEQVPSQQTQGEKPKVRPRTEADATVEVRGQVQNPEGKPVAGAKLYLAKPASDGPAAPQATSGSDGRFRIAVPRSVLAKGTGEKSSAQILAVAKGYGCDWATVHADGKGGE